MPMLRKTYGKMVYELRPSVDWHKGKAVEWLMEQFSKNSSEVRDRDRDRGRGRARARVYVQREDILNLALTLALTPTLTLALTPPRTSSPCTSATT